MFFKWVLTQLINYLQYQITISEDPIFNVRNLIRNSENYLEIDIHRASDIFNI